MPEGCYALANPGGDIVAFNINNDFNVFGIQTRINTTFTACFPDIQDEPVQLERPKLDQQWWDNLGTGLLLVAGLAACAALTICTCGMGLGAAALIGAAIGAAAVTAAVSVADAKTGHGRSADDFAKQLLLGAGLGAIAGACIYWMGPAIASQIAGKVGGLTVMGNGVVGSLATTFNAPWLVSAMAYVPTIAKVTVYTIVGVNGVRKGNDVLNWITGEDLILDVVFGGNEDAYQTASDIFDAADEFLDAIPDVDLDSPSTTTNNSSQSGTDNEPYEPPHPLNEAEQAYVDRYANAVNNYADTGATAMDNYANTGATAMDNYSNTGATAMDNYANTGATAMDNYANTGTNAQSNYVDANAPTSANAVNNYADTGATAMDNYANTGATAMDNYSNTGAAAMDNYANTGANTQSNYANTGADAQSNYVNSNASASANAGNNYADSGANAGNNSATTGANAMNNSADTGSNAMNSSATTGANAMNSSATTGANAMNSSATTGSNAMTSATAGSGGNSGVVITNGSTPGMAVNKKTGETLSFEDIMSQMDDLDFSTPPDSAIFYSGPGNLDTARAYAKANGGMLMEGTDGGKFLNGFDFSQLTQEQQNQIWTQASTRYANQATGGVVVFSVGASSSSIYSQTEAPIINESSSITAVIQLLGTAQDRGD